MTFTTFHFAATATLIAALGIGCGGQDSKNGKGAGGTAAGSGGAAYGGAGGGPSPSGGATGTTWATGGQASSGSASGGTVAAGGMVGAGGAAQEGGWAAAALTASGGTTAGSGGAKADGGGTGGTTAGFGGAKVDGGGRRYDVWVRRLQSRRGWDWRHDRLGSAAPKPTGVGLAERPPGPASTVTITPGSVWNDTQGNVIQAHGEGIIEVDGKYYWLGEDKTNGSAFQNVKCYASSDLKNWTFVNNVLTRQASGDLGPNRVIERPHVIYNRSTSQFVMYMHVDNSNYTDRKAGVATSSSVCGSYTYRRKHETAGPRQPGRYLVSGRDHRVLPQRGPYQHQAANLPALRRLSHGLVPGCHGPAV
jgi:hypothetical protein